MPKLLRNILQLMGVVFLRFATVPRLWCVWLVGLHGVGLAFISHIEALVVLAVTALAVVLQAVIYGRIGFTRILGISHLLWIPMFAWMATRVDSIAADPGLATWLAVLAATNATCLIVDLIEGWRFYRGDRAPHYTWARA